MTALLACVPSLLLAAIANVKPSDSRVKELVQALEGLSREKGRLAAGRKAPVRG